MDDTSQKQNQDNNQVGQPVNPVSIAQKEVEVAPVSDYIVPSETSPRIEKEVVDAGVKEVNQAPNLTSEHFNAGIRHSAENTPVQIEPTGLIKLPMTQSQAQQEAKGSTDNATTWLANFILRILKKMRVSSTGS
jgi:hypothetical protein